MTAQQPPPLVLVVGWIVGGGVVVVGTSGWLEISAGVVGFAVEDEEAADGVRRASAGASGGSM